MAFQYQESSSSGGSSSASNSGTLPWYNKQVQDLLGRGQQLSKAPWETFQGPRVADFVTDQTNAFQNLRGQMGNWQPNMQQANQATGAALGSMQGLQQSPYTQGALGALGQMGQLSQFNPAQQQQHMNPYISNVTNEIARLGNQNFQDVTLNALNSNFTDAGQFGSARQMAMTSDAAARNQREISGQQGQALMQAQNQAGQQYADWANRGIGAQGQIAQGNMGVNQFLQGLGTATGQLGAQYGQLGQMGQQMGFADVGQLRDIGNQQQALDQARLGANQAQFQEQQQAPWQPLNQWANLFKVPTPQASSSSSSSSNSSNSWGTSFKRGGLAQAKKFADGGLMSDSPDDILEQLISQGLSSHGQGTGPELANRAMQMRTGLMDYARNIPELQQKPERSFMSQAGEAMLRSAAQGPANWGQLIGRAGASYFDIGDADEKENQARAMARLNIMRQALPSVSASAGSRAQGGQPSPEVVRTVYSGARNEAAQIAKDYQFSTAAERAQFIENYANKAVQNYLGRFATQPVLPRGLNGDPSGPVDNVLSTDTSTEISKLSAPATTEVPVSPTMTPPQATEQVDPALRNKPEEARREKFSVGTEEMAQKSYLEDIKPGAKAAEGMLNSISMLRQIPRTQDAFAPYREIVGSVFDALGLDGRLAREAENLQQVRPLLSKVANDRLLQAKGVQTEGDAQRSFNEFVKITDTQKAADFMYTWTEELARRAKAKDQMYSESAQALGTWSKGDEIWRDSDYMKTPPVALIDGEPWGYTEWREAFSAANPNATVFDAMKVWKKLAGAK